MSNQDCDDRRRMVFPPKMPKNTDKALAEALRAVRDRHGKGVLVQGGRGFDSEVEVIPSGSLSLDLAIGYQGKCCGIPRGRITQLSGKESGGKSTLSLHAVGNAQKIGLLAAYVDAEYSLDVRYATQLGVDTSQLYVCEPEYGEQAIDVTEKLVASGAFGIIVVDSVAALTPKAELEGEIGDSHVGLLPRLVTQFLRQVSSDLNRKNVALILINQLRENIGGAMSFGPKTTTPGGRGLKHYCSLMVEVTRIASLKMKDHVVGARTKVVVSKNKMAPPKREGEFDLLYGRGVSREGELFDLGVRYGIIEKAGATYSFGREMVRGREAAKELLADQEIAGKLEAMIRLEAAKEVIGE